MATGTLTITLSDDLAAMVRAKVASGDYASEIEVVEDGLLALAEASDPFVGPAFDRWVREELRPAIEAHRDDPSRSIPIDVVRANLDELYAQARAAR